MKLALAIISLLGAVFAWWIKADAEAKKKKEAEDAKIDACSDADSVLLELDRLRRKDTSSGAEGH